MAVVEELTKGGDAVAETVPNFVCHFKDSLQDAIASSVRGRNTHANTLLDSWSQERVIASSIRGAARTERVIKLEWLAAA
jgi:hypothetical protein